MKKKVKENNKKKNIDIMAKHRCRTRRRLLHLLSKKEISIEYKVEEKKKNVSVLNALVYSNKDEHCSKRIN